MTENKMNELRKLIKADVRKHYQMLQEEINKGMVELDDLLNDVWISFNDNEAYKVYFDKFCNDDLEDKEFHKFWKIMNKIISSNNYKYLAIKNRETTASEFIKEFDFDRESKKINVPDYKITIEDVIAAGYGIDAVDRILDEEIQEKGKSLSERWTDTRLPDKKYLIWVAMWSAYDTLGPMQKRFIKPYLINRRKMRREELYNEFPEKSRTYVNMRWANIWKTFVERTLKFYNKYLANEALEN